LRRFAQPVVWHQIEISLQCLACWEAECELSGRANVMTDGCRLALGTRE
jgi:hypothetical protein